MKESLYEKFLKSGDTLWVYHRGKEIFTSKEKFLFPLLDYIDKFLPERKEVMTLDRIMGNAAALLSVKALAVEVWSPLGSKDALTTLDKYEIEQHIFKVVPFIQNNDGTDICPMEKLSVSQDMSPDEFYEAVLERYRVAGIKRC